MNDNGRDDDDNSTQKCEESIKCLFLIHKTMSHKIGLKLGTRCVLAFHLFDDLTDLTSFSTSSSPESSPKSAPPLETDSSSSAYTDTMLGRWACQSESESVEQGSYEPAWQRSRPWPPSPISEGPHSSGNAMHILWLSVEIRDFQVLKCAV